MPKDGNRLRARATPESDPGKGTRRRAKLLVGKLLTLSFARWVMIVISIISYVTLAIFSGVTGWPPFTGSTKTHSWEGALNIPDPLHPLDASIAITPPELAGANEVTFSVDGFAYYAPAEKNLEGYEFCIDYIQLVEVYEDGGQGLSSLFQGPLCTQLRPGLTIQYEDGNAYRYSVGPSSIAGITIRRPSSFWYPYDGFSMELVFLVAYRLVSNGQAVFTETISPPIWGSATGGLDWDISLDTKEDLDVYFSPNMDWVGVDEHNVKQFNGLAIHLRRPVLQLVVYPVVLLAMFLLIIAFSFAKSLDTFLQGALAILFGLFGIKEVLVPSNIGRRTILDLVILGLYFLFFIALLLSLFAIARENRSRQKLP